MWKKEISGLNLPKMLKNIKDCTKMLKIFFLFKNFLLNLLFPLQCINCQKEGNYLCEDCFALIDIVSNQYCPFCRYPKIVSDGRVCNSCRKKGKNLNGLFFAASYENFVVKKIISQFKYRPYVKDLAKTLVFLIIHYFQLLDKKTIPVKDAFLIPIPLTKKRLKKRGFNQAEEIAKELSVFLKIPFLKNVLIKIKETLPQVELFGKEREKNIKGVFVVRDPKKFRGKKILLVDDVFTTGSTMEECAGVLKESGAKEVWGIVVARG